MTAWLMEDRRPQQPWGFTVAPILARLATRLGVLCRGPLCGHKDAIRQRVPNAHGNGCDVQNASMTRHARDRADMIEGAPVQHVEPHPAELTPLTVNVA